MSASLDDLIARLAQATEGSCELDAAIYLHLSRWENAEIVTRCYPRSELPFRTGILRRTTENHVVFVDQFPSYTTLLDAALTLVPEGSWWTVAAGKTRPDEPLYGAAIYEAALIGGGRPPIAAAEHDHSAAIALCIAGLKALEAEATQ